MAARTKDLVMISVDRPEHHGAGAYRKTAVRKNGAKARRIRKLRKRRRRLFVLGVCAAALLAVCYQTNWFTSLPAAGRAGKVKQLRSKGDYPDELLALAEQNEETFDFVKDYEKREKYVGKEIDLSGDYKAGSVPLLMQWDKRWGYDGYGDAMIGLSGCGPTCMAMAYLYYTGDLTMNPRTIAQYAQENGYHTEEGTSWSFWTDGAAGLGLQGQQVALSENVMKSVLDVGGVLVCSMAPGDFTTQGHYILLRGYDENGFFVNDPNRRSNSEKQWDYETLSGQIKNLWSLYGQGR